MSDETQTPAGRPTNQEVRETLAARGVAFTLDWPRSTPAFELAHRATAATLRSWQDALDDASALAQLPDAPPAVDIYDDDEGYRVGSAWVDRETGRVRTSARLGIPRE